MRGLDALMLTRTLAIAAILFFCCAAESQPAPNAQRPPGSSAAPAFSALAAIADKEWLTQSSRALLERIIAAASKAALDEAAKTDPRAQALVGAGHSFGTSGYPRSDADAARFYRLAVGTNVVAQNGLGEMIENGRTDSGGAAALAVAARYYGMAARQGHVGAEANLGRLYSHGSGVAQNFSEALRWLTLAASQGNPQAQNDLGNLYQSGLGVARNDAEGQRLIKLAADQGNADALHSLGVTAFLQLAKKGVYDADEATTSLFAKALAAYQRDAAAGSTYAIRNVAEMYYLGNGVAQDVDVAYANYRRAANLGDLPALVEIGQMTERGDGVAKNEPEAARIYRECADKGDTTALLYLARMIETGRGGLKADKAEAIRLYKQAESRGDSVAPMDLQRLADAGATTPTTPPQANAPSVAGPTPEQIAGETSRMVGIVGGEMYRRAQSRLSNACANESNKRFAENGAVDQIKERQENAACAARAQAGAEQEGQKAQACAQELLTRNPRMQTAAIYEGVTACMQASAIQQPPASVKATTDKTVGAARTPTQVPVAAPASPPSTPAAPQTQNAAAQNAARSNTALERTMKTQACGSEAMKKLGPNALSEPAAFQKIVQDCLQR